MDLLWLTGQAGHQPLHDRPGLVVGDAYHYQPLWDTLRQAQAYVAEHPDLVRPGEQGAVGVVCLLMQVLDLEIQAENAAHRGDLTGAANLSRQAVILADRVTALADELPAHEPDLREFMIARALALRIYDDCTARAADAVDRYFRTASADLNEAIAALAKGETSELMPAHYDRSILKAHRLSLQALREVRDREWVRVDQGRVTCVYPFAIRGKEPRRVVAEARDGAAQWTLGGRRPTDVHGWLQLDDLWDGADQLGRQYNGVCIALPDVVVHDEDGNQVDRLRAELRLSNLGNHYLRFESDLLDASPLGVHTVMFRAAPESGVGPLGFEACLSPTRLSDFAMRLAYNVCDNLGGAKAGVEVIARPGMFHVVVSVYAASLVGPGPLAMRRRPVHDIDAFSSGAGSQLFTNPIPHSIGAIAEWVRYPTRPHGVPQAVSVHGDHIARTVNTTCILMLGSPQYSAENRASIAEFVASLDGLFAGWLSELGSHYERSNQLQRDVQIATRQQLPGLDQLSTLMRRLDETRGTLHAFAIEARSTIAAIESPSLVVAPAAVAVVTALLHSSAFASRVRDLNTKIDQVLEERLRLMIGQIAAQRTEQEALLEARADRTRRAKLDAMLAIIAAVGVSGLAQILQTGYEIKYLPALLVTLAILIFSVIVGAVVWWLSGRSATRHTTGRGPEDPLP